MATLGRIIIVYKDGVPVAGCKSDELNTDCQMIEISSAVQAVWREYISGRKGWSITSNYLLTTSANIRDLLKVGDEVTIRAAGPNGSGAVTGSAIVETCRVTASIGSLAQGVFTFRGNGALSIS